jgi:hypothetical protein
MSEPIPGACLCGAVTFDVSPPYRWFAHCHCSMCRKHHGALFATSLGVAHERFRWRSGEADIVHYRATAAFERPFCRHCGSNVPAVSHEATTLEVPAGLLDGDLGAQPRAHIFVGSMSSMHTITDALPQHDAYPSGIDLPVVAQLPTLEPIDGEVRGSCLCRAVEFAVEATPRRIVNCYCSLCRRSRGTGFASTLLASPERFRWLKGEERVATYALPAPRTYRTDFCADCGSPVPTLIPESPVVMLPAGAIDTALPPLPAVHLYVGSKAAWCEITDSWPKFDELPPPERFTEIFV